MFTNGLGDLGSIPRCVIPKTLKMVLDTSLLNTQQYKVHIKAKWSDPGKRVAISPTPRCSSYWKGSLLVALDYGRQLFFTYFCLGIIIICNMRESTLAEGDPKAPFSIATTLRCREGCFSIPWAIWDKLYYLEGTSSRWGCWGIKHSCLSLFGIYGRSFQQSHDQWLCDISRIKFSHFLAVDISLRRIPFLSSPLCEKYIGVNDLLRIFPSPGNCKCSTAAVQYSLFFGTVLVTFLWFGISTMFYDYV